MKTHILQKEPMAESNKARLAIMELANMISVPMSLVAVVRLKIPDAVWQNGSNTPVSATQILTRVQAPSTADPDNLQRILRMLTSCGVFNEHVTELDKENNVVERKYSLTEIGMCLVRNSEGLSHADYILQHHQDVVMRALPLVHEAVLDPTTEPFVKANGVAAYSLYGKQPEMNELMVKAMSGISVPFMKAFLDGYDGFQGVETLVDVGGSGGDCLKMIMEKFPNIKHGINFDVPEVVAKAPTIPGITHVGGDFYKSIPEGDAIFMKYILTWTDDECTLILENCYKALPAGGKLILCEPVLPKHSDDTRRTRALLAGDIFLMTIYRSKHRTEEEFRQLGYSVGFSQFKALYNIDDFFATLEFQK